MSRTTPLAVLVKPSPIPGINNASFADSFFADVHQLYPLGSTLTSTFSPGLVAASYFASLCGCLLTIELLHHRGNMGRGWQNYLATFGCATVMALVGVWCMHFIGNRAIILGNGSKEIQLVYSPRFTTLSVFLPIICLTIAFWVADSPTQSKVLHWSGLVTTGVIAGLSVAGMHYIGNLGISNYSLDYQHTFIAASFVISVVACLAVLILFYTLREKWISAWWKRHLCGVVLAAGISAMHFTASTNCIYTLKKYNTAAGIRSRDIQVGVAGGLTGPAAVSLLCLVLFTRHRANVLRTRSQKFMLACVLFCRDARILITGEGVLPSAEITDKYHHRTFVEEFDNRHAVFQWLFRLSHDWTNVVDLIPKMKKHLRAHPDYANEISDESETQSSQSSAVYDPNTYVNYETLFYERFCSAAATVARLVGLPLTSLGVLYDKVIDTGTLDDIAKGSKNDQPEVESTYQLKTFGKGQLLFLTRYLTEDDVNQALRSGMRIAAIPQVSNSIAMSMQIPQATLETHLGQLKAYNEQRYSPIKGGIWLCAFLMLPKPHSKMFDIVVRKENRGRLPDVQLWPDALQPWQIALLQRMEGWTMAKCLAYLNDYTNIQTLPPWVNEHMFVQEFKKAITRLLQCLPTEWHAFIREESRFFAKSLQAHYSPARQGPGTTTTLYAFTLILDMHVTTKGSALITRVPVNFLTDRHRCYAGSPDHAVFAQDIKAILGPVLSRPVAKDEPSGLRQRLSTTLTLGNLRSAIRRDTPPGTLSPSLGEASASGGSSVYTTDDHSWGTELVTNPRHRLSEAPHKGNLSTNSLDDRVDSRMDSQLSTSTLSSSLPAMGITFNCDEPAATPETTFIEELSAYTTAHFTPVKSSVLGWNRQSALFENVSR